VGKGPKKRPVFSLFCAQSLDTRSIKDDHVHHESLLLLLKAKGELHKAPLPLNPHRNLDIGTGTGIWAVDMAVAYPSAEVIGTALSPIQPNSPNQMRMPFRRRRCRAPGVG
jgi:tRNA G46 methylase TrmB